MKKNNIFWGVVLVLLAVLIIVSEMGFVEGIGFWTVVFSVIFGAMLIRGIIKFDMTQILFSLAFLCIAWDDVLGIEAITPWPVLLAALLGSIGFSMIFGGKKKKIYKEKFRSSHNATCDTVEQDYGEEVKCAVSFGSIVKYIKSENLKTVNASVSFGSASIYLDNAKAPSGEVVINIDSSFGGVELFVPKNWFVTNNMQNSFGGIDIENNNNGANEVNVILIGSASFAGVSVTYI